MAESLRRVSAKKTAYDRGQREANRGQYFNPYSKVSQRQAHLDYDAGWKSKNRRVDIPQPQGEKTTKYPQLVVLMLGITLATACYYAFFK